MSDLADLIRAKVPEKSNRQIAKAVGVAPGTIDGIMRGDRAPGLDTLDKIAHALKIPIEKLREAAGLPRGETAAYVPPAEANLLSETQRRALDMLIRSIVETRGATDAVVPDRSDPPAEAEGAEDQARQEQKTHALRRASSTAPTQGSDLATAQRKPQDLTANAHPHGPDRWPDGQPVYDEHWDQWKAWQEAGALPGAWEAFRAAERQQAYDLAARFIPGPTDKERMTTAQDQAAERPDREGPEGGA